MMPAIGAGSSISPAPYLVIRELIREIRAERPYYHDRGLIENLYDFSLKCDLKNPDDYYSVLLASSMEKLVGDFELKRNHPISEHLMTKIVQIYHDMFWAYSRYDAIFDNLPGGKSLRFPENGIPISENIRRRYRIRENHCLYANTSDVHLLAQELKAIAYSPMKSRLFFEDAYDLVLARLSI